MDERLKRYEALLREKGIDPDQVIDPKQGASTSDFERTRNPSEDSDRAWQLPIQSTVFKPQLLQGQGNTEFVDK